MIPEDWHYQELNEVIAALDAGASVNAEDRPKSNDEIGVLKVSAVTYGTFDPTAYKVVVDASERARLSIVPQRDTIIVSRANTKSLVGASAYIDQDYPDLFLPDKLWRLTVVEGISARWLSYVLALDQIRAEISDLATGTSASMKNISQEAFLSIPVPLPSFPEQRAIAAILSTWDEAITLTTRLIEALKRRKQALMQLLLTGEVRFAEFDGEWEEVAIGEIVTPVSRSEIVNPTRNYGLIGVKWYVAGAHIHEIRSGSDIITEALSLIQAGDIIYNKMWVTKAAFAVAHDEHHGAYGTSEYPQFLPRQDKLLADYIEYVFHYPQFQYQAIKFARGSTGRARLNPSDFLKIQMSLPSTNEQEKITALLQSVDIEIVFTESILTRLIEQKRGLMQQLLTGAVRVQVKE